MPYALYLPRYKLYKIVQDFLHPPNACRMEHHATKMCSLLELRGRSLEMEDAQLLKTQAVNMLGGILSYSIVHLIYYNKLP